MGEAVDNNGPKKQKDMAYGQQKAKVQQTALMKELVLWVKYVDNNAKGCVLTGATGDWPALVSPFSSVECIFVRGSTLLRFLHPRFQQTTALALVFTASPATHPSLDIACTRIASICPLQPTNHGRVLLVCTPAERSRPAIRAPFLDHLHSTLRPSTFNPAIAPTTAHRIADTLFLHNPS
jgi:hypothetical protein